MEFTFKKRRCDVERLKRIETALTIVKTDYAKKDLEDLLNIELVRQQIQDYVVNKIHNDEFETVTDGNNKTAFKIKINYIDMDNTDTYVVKEGALIVQLLKENYADPKLNIGADYHSVRLMQPSGIKKIDYWYENQKPFLLEQINNQDKLQDMCDDLNYMKTVYLD